jgi:methyl-accepting chemotaxis protein
MDQTTQQNAAMVEQTNAATQGRHAEVRVSHQRLLHVRVARHH